MAMKRPAQVTGHQIDPHGREHHNHAEPDAPVPMRAFPIRRMAMMNRSAIRIFVRLVIVALDSFIGIYASTNHFRASAASSVIEVSDRRFRERLAECRHALLPLLFPDHREPLDVGEVMRWRTCVLPHRAGCPSRVSRSYRTARATFRAAGRVARTRAQSARNLLLPASR